MSPSDSTPTATARRSPVQLAALIYGVAFVLVGIAGFIPGLTTDVGAMEFGGHHSGAMLLGIFQVSILHNVVHLLYGVAGLLLARAANSARLYLLIGGAVYLVLWLYGMFIDKDSTANFVPLNAADDWLHLFLGVTMVAASFLSRGHTRRGTTATRTSF